jgi:hypothetical protein
MKQLPDAEIEAWRDALAVAQGGAVPDAWAMFFVADIPELFPSETFDASRSSAARSRLARVPNEAAKSLGALLKIEASYAAVLIAQNPDLFGVGGFGKPLFDTALKQLESRVATKE